MSEKRVQKVFSPVLMFNSSVKSCWLDNVRSVDGRLPIHEALAAAGQYAIYVEPQTAKAWYAFGLPLRKDWRTLDVSSMRAPQLAFEALAESPLTVRVQLAGEGDLRHGLSDALRVESTEDFFRFSLPLSGVPFASAARMVLFSGGSTSPRWLLRDVRVTEG